MYAEGEQLGGMWSVQVVRDFNNMKSSRLSLTRLCDLWSGYG